MARTPMRFAVSEKPTKEIEHFSFNLNHFEYLWWGANRAPESQFLLIVKKDGKTSYTPADGVLETVSCVKREDIDDDDFYSHRPTLDSGQGLDLTQYGPEADVSYTHYYKIVNAMVQEITMLDMFGKDGNPIEGYSHRTPGMHVYVRGFHGFQ